MWILILVLIVGGVALMLFTYFSRKKNITVTQEAVKEVDTACCGAHEVCTSDSLLQHSTEILYYDDEELDQFSGMAATDYTDEQQQLFSSIFHTLPEHEVAGWLKSLQLRSVELPSELKEEALLIVRERRSIHSN